MKMKRLLAGLLVLVMCFVLVACQKHTNDKNSSKTQGNNQTSDNPDASQGDATPLLYRVTDKSGNVVWLFGSIHVGREDYYPLPDYVLSAFEKADSLAVEMDIKAFEEDLGLQVQALSTVVYLDGSKISDHIPQELYEKAVEILEEYDSYLNILDMYYPALWSSMIESLMMEELGANANLGIDRHLIDMAYEADKEILEIESAEFQYQMLADFDNDIQIMLLESSVEAYEKKDEAATDLEKMMDLWAAGNESEFAAYLNASDDTMTDEEKEMYQRYNKAMLVDRNLAMADYAEDALLEGREIFICVGAAHIVGDGAVAELLSQRGYTVECIVK